jgi:hypothetical protein
MKNAQSVDEIFAFLFGPDALREARGEASIEVREVVLDDLEFAQLGRAMSYQRIARELRVEAAKVLQQADNMDRQAGLVLADLHTGLRAKGLGL